MSHSMMAADRNKQLGQDLCKAGRYAEAIPYLEKSVAQNRRSGALWYLCIARQHLYDFDGAIEALEAYMPVLNSEEWKSRADSLMTMCRIGQRAFEHTADVVVIDSMLVPRDSFFEYYKLGAESGRVMADEDAVFYENQLGDHRIYSDGHSLSECHRFQGQWEERHQLQGVGSEDFSVQYPFLRSDGETLYFASDSLPGLGGLDIYRTTYDSDEGKFYQAERLGMPFNSPYDDYMMAIDETHQVGWWATNRNAPADSVTIYLFLLDAEPQYLDDPTPELARLDCIANTWRETDGYAALVDELLNASQKAEPVQSLHVIVADGIVYTDESQFVSAEARNVYRLLQSVKQKIEESEQNLQNMRSEYARLNSESRSQTALQILDLEQELALLYRNEKELAITYRQCEGAVIGR